MHAETDILSRAFRAIDELCSRPPATAMADVVIPPVEAQPDSSSAPEPSALKSQAVELWRDGKRFFVVTDESDAQEAMRRFGARRGEIWTSGLSLSPGLRIRLPGMRLRP